MSKYFVISNDNNAYALAGNVNLKKLVDTLKLPQTLVVKLGDSKVLPKHMIFAVAKTECGNMEKYNIAITVGKQLLRDKVESVEATFNKLEKDLNADDFVLINNSMIVFRHAFTLAEDGTMIEQDETQA